MLPGRLVERVITIDNQPMNFHITEVTFQNPMVVCAYSKYFHKLETNIFHNTEIEPITQSIHRSSIHDLI